jgi:hypothetical protein
VRSRLQVVRNLEDGASTFSLGYSKKLTSGALAKVKVRAVVMMESTPSRV